ncbi:hypothetical protein GCM10015535_00460 [Streptomyces gelaticus]|uniref:Uncharacterized protein n=1 Tax=Streptomyces gelaticus TaxID=285446 RepID=A0ABQ2VPR4_9ACTN|nr:hypothetical protein GCM10015535_00460 [Streptomyces gelaticus]
MHWPGPKPGEFAEFEVADADPEEAFRIWHEECARSRAAVEAAESLDITRSYGDEVSLRYILTHMIEEYATTARRTCSGSVSTASPASSRTAPGARSWRSGQGRSAAGVRAPGRSP